MKVKTMKIDARNGKTLKHDEDERCTDGYGRLDTEKGLRTRTLVWTYRHGRNMDGRKSWWG